jgi:hypothetical protein
MRVRRAPRIRQSSMSSTVGAPIVQRFHARAARRVVLRVAGKSRTGR